MTTRTPANAPWNSEGWIEPDWTPRQLEVLPMIASGLTNQQIADALDISHAGAKWHVSEVTSKLGVPFREDVEPYWRWRNRWHRRLGRVVHALLPIGAFKIAVGGTAVAALGIGAVAVGVTAWPSDDANDDDPPQQVAEGPRMAAHPAPGWTDGEMLFDFDPQPFGPGTIQLTKLVDRGYQVSACYAAEGFTPDQRRAVIPSVIMVDAAGVVSRATGSGDATDRCDGGDEAVFDRPDADPVQGARLEAAMSLTAIGARDRAHANEIDTLLDDVGATAAFEWGSQPIGLPALNHRLDTPLPYADGAPAASVVGIENALLIAEFPTDTGAAALHAYWERGTVAMQSSGGPGGGIRILFAQPERMRALGHFIGLDGVKGLQPARDGVPARSIVFDFLMGHIEPGVATTIATLDDGSELPLELFPAPPELGIDFQFIYADVTGLGANGLNAYDADGNLLWQQDVPFTP